MTAILLGLRGGLHDAKAGHPPYLFGLLFGAKHRRDLLRSRVAAIRNLLAFGIIMDIVFQVVLYHSVHPGAALLVGPILICFPYAVSRALTTRAEVCGEIPTREQHHEVLMLKKMDNSCVVDYYRPIL